MGHVFVKQPDGLYAMFSTIDDTFVFIDATKEELIDDLVEFEVSKARDLAYPKAERLVARLDTGKHRTKLEKNFYECISTAALYNPNSKLLKILMRRFNLKPRTTNDS